MSTDGDNVANDGLSESTPWKTVGKRNSGVTGADTVKWKRGQQWTGATNSDAAITPVANGQTDTFFGNADAPPDITTFDDAHHAVSLGAIDGHILRGLKLSGLQTVTTKNLVANTGACANLLVEDCNLIGGANAILLSAGTGHIARKVYALNQWTDGFSVSGTGTRLAVSDFYIQGTGVANGAAGSGDALTSHDTAAITGRDGVVKKCGRVAVCINTAGTNIFERITVEHDNDAVDLYMFAQTGGGTMHCFDLEVFLAGTEAIYVFTQSGSVMVVGGCAVRSRNTNVASRVFYSGATGLLAEQNNISWQNGSLHYHCYQDGVTMAGGTNCYFPDHAGGFHSAIDVANFAAWAVIVAETGSIVTDPKLHATGAADLYQRALRLQAGSPCINTGTDLSAFFTKDRHGRGRPVGAAYDMGAYEFRGGPHDAPFWMG